MGDGGNSRGGSKELVLPDSSDKSARRSSHQLNDNSQKSNAQVQTSSPKSASRREKERQKKSSGSARGKKKVPSPSSSSQKEDSTQPPRSSDSVLRKQGGAEQKSAESHHFTTDGSVELVLSQAQKAKKSLGGWPYRGSSHSQNGHPPFFPIELHVSYFEWAAMAMPPAFFYLCASYAVLLVCFMGFGELLLWRKPSPDEQAQQDNIGRMIRTSYDDLGSMTFAEKSVMSWFGVLVLLWATRDLGFVRGWGDLLFAPDHAKMLTESVSGIVVVYVMFLWPKYGFGDEQRSRRPLKANENDRILTWPIITEKLSWSIIILVGCGFCISEGVTASGLSKMVEGFVRGMHDVNPLIVQAILMAVVVAMTNFMSNSGTANIFVPLAMDAAKGLNWHPYRLGLLAAIGPSLAFMLPMATPSNALVYDTGYISFFELFYTGALVNVFCIAVTIFSVNTWAYWVLNMKVDVWGIAPTNATMTLLNGSTTAAPDFPSSTFVTP
ncbi:unnamed protein product, partial [Mesorhabditis spiculigera]